MTVFDYAFLGLLCVMAILGFWRGLISEVLALAGWILGFIVARMFAGQVAFLFADWISEPAFAYLAAFALIFLAVLVLVAVVRYALRALIHAVGLGFVDRGFGALFGTAKAVAIACLLVAFGGASGLSRAPWWEAAMFSPLLETAVVAAKPWMPNVVAERVSFR
ncbi:MULTISPECIES: CvpA family protein [Denitromonas]|jgi:membrane protein required for colicin V production|uniref:CvpA family protein n=2 Tax=Denitromonas TaxID=139331 RepID=A0A558EYR4_9RHOO|nr:MULTISPECIES: CvpA family protein [Denitromonas]TVO58038.1 CvpA family protein [Denitromonas halophila]TVO69188.1 CvpA family protein [Denitromonas ohlonensis]TVO77288.1 CvpA family protein [Denitromonas ohlonensis]TVT50312.1 MAG: CvpA family protein [Denitromonas halophila]TVT74983.1 MAG: CvpA family protein [Denitromonas halophila]